MDSENGGGRQTLTNSLDLQVEAFPKSGSSQFAQSITRYLNNRFNFRKKCFILGLIAAVMIISAGISIPIALSFRSSTSTTEIESTSTSTTTMYSTSSKPPPSSPFSEIS